MTYNNQTLELEALITIIEMALWLDNQINR